MKLAVIYRPPAQDELANIWLNSPDRQAVADASDQIDRILASNPLGAGESRGGNARIFAERPLAMLFDVYPDDALVEVFAVFRWRRRKP